MKKIEIWEIKIEKWWKRRVAKPITMLRPYYICNDNNPYCVHVNVYVKIAEVGS